MDLKAIGKRIKKVRLDKDYSQMQLSEMANISSVHLSHIETGRVTMSLDCLINLCNCLEVTPNYILVNEFKGEDNNKKEALIDTIKDMTSDEITFLLEIGKLLIKMKINQ